MFFEYLPYLGVPRPKSKLFMLDIFDKPHADPARLFLANSPWPLAGIVSFYLIFVLKLGRKFMAKREPYDLRHILLLYNVLQVIYNGAMFVLGVLHLAVSKPYNLSCMSVLSQDNPLKNFDRWLCYAYYINKCLDLLDTIFIIFRKNYRQITFLHLLHHLYMPIANYFVIRFIGYGGHPFVMGILNTFVHIVMYNYYLIASQTPSVKRQIWWKRYLTKLQMLQFVLIAVHSMWTMRQPGCNVSRPLVLMMLIMASTMFGLFSNFYINAYCKQPQKEPPAELNEVSKKIK